MFERFTEAARRLVVHCQEEARSLGHNHIGTEHILLGILALRGARAEGPITELLPTVTIERVRARVLEIVGPGDPAKLSGHIPFTPRAKKVLELSLRESLRLGHNGIDVGHVLLAILAEGEGVAAAVLRLDFELDFDELRREVESLLPPKGTPIAEPPPARGDLRSRVDELESRVADLTAQVAELRRRLGETG